MRDEIELYSLAITFILIMGFIIFLSIRNKQLGDELSAYAKHKEEMKSRYEDEE